MIPGPRRPLGLMILATVVLQISACPDPDPRRHRDLSRCWWPRRPLRRQRHRRRDGLRTGLLLDLALGTNLGASSLVLTTVGYGVGRYREQRDPAHGLTPIPVAAAATAGYVLAYGAVSFMLSIDAPVRSSWCGRCS